MAQAGMLEPGEDKGLQAIINHSKAWHLAKQISNHRTTCVSLVGLLGNGTKSQILLHTPASTPKHFF